MQVTPAKKSRKQKADSGNESALSLSDKKANRKRVVILASLLIGLLIAAFLLGTPTALVNSWARASLRKCDYESAQRWIGIAEKYVGRNAETYLIAARVARHEGQYDKMSWYLSEARRRGAKPQATKMEEALALAQSGSLATVESDLVAWLSQGEGEADEISDAYANGLAAASRFDTAAEVLSTWQSDYPDDPRPDYRLGRLSENLQDWKQAEILYKRSLQRNPQFYPSLFRLGKVLVLGRRMEEARDVFQKCAESRLPQAPLTQLAFCLRSLGDTEGAIKVLREVMHSPESVIDESYARLGESPDRFEAAAALGDLESESGNYEAALPLLEKALLRNSRDLEARYAYAVTLRELGRLDEAQVEMEKVTLARKELENVNPLRNKIVEEPNNPEPRLELGKILLQYESDRTGLFWINSVFAINPNHQAAHLTLANYYRELAKASPDYQRVADYHSQAASSSTSP